MKILLIIFFFLNSNSLFGNLYDIEGTMPIIRMTADANLGLSIGLGLYYYIADTRGGIHEGYYSIYTMSKKGSDLAFGYTSNWLYTFGYGIAMNRINIKNNSNQIFWGLSAETQIFSTFITRIGFSRSYNSKVNSSENFSNKKVYRKNSGVSLQLPLFFMGIKI